MTHTPIPETPPQLPWILVVDDEASMRVLIETVLRTQGWTSRMADGADQALEAVRSALQPPAVVICDVLMPGLDGLELIRRMSAKLPDLPVIFISGHLTDVSWWPTDLREHRFLAKPFEVAQLVSAVRDALSGAASGF
jgi:two-component system cell cycle sensor histidine kinase/response regulator CckA